MRSNWLPEPRRGSTPRSAWTTSGISCSKHVPTSLTTAASRFGFCPACSMPAMDSDICRSVTRCAVSLPMTTAARSSGSRPTSRISSMMSRMEER